MKVKCPNCGKIAEYAPENIFRPFCSERCQTLDLGAWADETYKVPVSEGNSHTVNENSEALSVGSDSPPLKDRFN